MTPSQACYDLIKRFEGCELKAYIDPVGILTIGYGHTGADVFVGKEITQDEADALLEKDFAHAAKRVNDLVRVPISQGEYDALVSFVYNVGETNFENSSLLKKLNAGDFLGASQQIMRWVHGGGRELPGLVTRRAAEQAMFDLG